MTRTMGRRLIEEVGAVGEDVIVCTNDETGGVTCALAE